MTEVLRQEREQAHWKVWQEKADLVWGWQTPAGKVRAARRAGLFRNLARMEADSIVLEIGCGTGEFSERIAPHVKELCATDLSLDLLARARQRLKSASGNVVFEQQDATRLNLPDDTFDAVFGCSMLHHVDTARALREVRRVLKPGGWCVFSEPNMLNPQIALQKNVSFIKRHVGDSPDETAFFRWELARLLHETGFTRGAVEPFDWLHPLTPPTLIPIMDRLGRVFEAIPLVRSFSGSLILHAKKPGRS